MAKSLKAKHLAYRISWSFVAFLIFYVGLYVVLSTLPASSAQKRRAGKVSIYVRTNGFHTDLILPIRTALKDWQDLVGTSKNTTHIAFGWGDRGFYLGEPSEFQFWTAFKALFYLGTAVVHTHSLGEPAETAKCKRLWLSESEYEALTKYIEASFWREGAGKVRIIKTSQYSHSHAFFEAQGRYSLFYTCNTWVGEALKKCHQPTCIWTPFASGIFYFL